jgi:hypothetical protein
LPNIIWAKSENILEAGYLIFRISSLSCVSALLVVGADRRALGQRKLLHLDDALFHLVARQLRVPDLGLGVGQKRFFRLAQSTLVKPPIIELNA